MGLFGYRLFLKTENTVEIIFKCVNSVVGSSFKVVFVEKSTCRYREQCTGPTKKRWTLLKNHLSSPNVHYIIIYDTKNATQENKGLMLNLEMFYESWF